MSSGGGAGPLVPTFHGFVHNSMDGLVLFEACLSGKLHHVPRRPHDRERSSLIKSGSIFIYEENASGIKRWTDGVAWSPSRILGNFLIYRELEKPFPPGEKKRAMKRKRTSIPGEPYPRQASDERETHELPTPLTPPSPRHHHLGDAKPDVSGSDQDKELERSLIGSLVDSYGFRPDGLVKKTMSINVNGISHHMVSYYKIDDVKNNLLPRPLSDQRLANISVRPELYLKQNFRAPVEETEQYAIDGHMHAHPQMMYAPMNSSPYGIRPGQYFGAQYPVYNTTSTGASVYNGLTTTAWPHTSPSAGYTAHGGYASQTYGSPYYKGGSSESRPDPTHAATQSSGYGNHYASAYQGMQRSASHGTPSAMHTAYSTGPAATTTSSSPYGPAAPHVGPRHSYSGASGGSHSTPHTSHVAHSPTGAGQPQHLYSSSAAQSYAVRSPTQSYTMHSASANPVTQSPHASLKSPMSATHTPTESSAPLFHPSGSHYRTAPSTYGVSAAHSSTNHSSSDLNGLGISANSAYASHGSSQPGYGHYGTASSAFRSAGEVPAPHSTAQYAS